MSGRSLIAALALLLAAGGVAAVLADTSSPSAAGKKDGGGEAIVVQRRDLVQTDTESGTLSYADPRTVYDRLAGTITWLPSAGRVIRPGGTLFAVDGRPVILLDGSTPAYRDLAPGDSDGPDILQLNRNLVALGFDPVGIVLDQEWQAATTAGVEQLQTSLGESPTGSFSLGQVVFLPGDQIVAGVEATLGSGGGGSSGSGSPASAGSPAATGASDPRAAPTVAAAASASDRPPAVAAMYDVALAAASGTGAAKPNPSSPPAGPKPSGIRRLEALVARLQAEIAKLAAQGKSPGAGSPQSPGGNQPSGSGSPSGSPEGGASPTPILQTTSTRLVVTVNLEAGKQSEARVGGRVSVELPGGVTVNGRVTDVGRVAQQSTAANGGGEPRGGAGSGGSGSTVPVTITLAGRGAGANLDQAGVSVNFTQEIARHVLCVPVTALLATPGAGYAVQEAAQPQRLIPVSTGLFAAGFVQISGAGVHPGLRVTNSQG